MKDYYWINDVSTKILKRGSLKNGTSALDRIDQIAQRAEEILKIDGYAVKFKAYMAKGFYSLASPVWKNFGLNYGLPISCNGTYIADDMAQILHSQSEVGMQTKHAAGTSGYFGDIRGRGELVNSEFPSTGSVSMMELFDSVTSIVSQGSARRGSFAAYLPADHADILEFLDIRSEGHPLQEIFFGVCCSDDYMNKVKDGDAKAREVWAKIIRKGYETGMPYLHFTDNANNQAPEAYKKHNKRINASNLCVTANQRVVSDRGLLTVGDLYEQGGELILFDNKKEVESSKMQLIEEDAEVFRITLGNGMKHEITPDHKVLVIESGSEKMVACKDLSLGDKVAIQTQKGIFGGLNKEKEAFLLGLYQSDGTQHKDLIMFDVWENDFDLLDEIQKSHDYVCDEYETQVASNNRVYDNPSFSNCTPSENGVKKRRLTGKACKKALNFEKGYVPNWIWESDEATQWQYLKGLLYADGTAFMSSSKGNPLQISYTDINKGFLEELQILFANLGLQSSLRIMREAGPTLLPDGKGGSKFYNTKEAWRIIVGNKPDGLAIEKKTGFLSRKGITIEDRPYHNNTKKSYEVVAIEEIENQDVYCVTVDSDEHLWVCNGVVTSNCNEIQLSNDEKESFVCCLSSINVEHWDDIKDTDAVETLLFFLDAVMEEYIQKVEGIPFMEKCLEFAKNQRALGLGVLGYHSLLCKKEIPFESMEAKLLNGEVFKTIREKCDKATEELAKMFGEPELLKGFGRRNITTMAVAPTTTSSLILGQVSQGIEPYQANYFVKGSAKGNFTIINPYFLKLLDKYGKNDRETLASVRRHGGSCQHLDFLTDHDKAVYKTFGEISQKEIIIQAAQRQKYIDQGQSLNMMVPPDCPAKQVSNLLIEAWELGLKGLYYRRSANPAQELSRNIDTCTSCEG